jgi:sulfide:quinone oxidoreductase
MEVMPSAAGAGGSRHVVIAGGGFAALEAALALRALTSERIRLRLSLISLSTALAYRPAATAEAFTPAPPLAYALPAIAGALTFRDQRDVPAFRAILRELDAGELRRLAFAVPPGPSWPLPAYELALMAAAHAGRRRLETEITLVSVERAPLAVFGERASGLVDDLLYERGVRFIGESAAARFGDGRLELQFGGSINADRVVAIPRLRADPIAGLPGSWWGFVQTDIDGRVEAARSW